MHYNSRFRPPPPTPPSYDPFTTTLPPHRTSTIRPCSPTSSLRRYTRNQIGSPDTNASTSVSPWHRAQLIAEWILHRVTRHDRFHRHNDDLVKTANADDLRFRTVRARLSSPRGNTLPADASPHARARCPASDTSAQLCRWCIVHHTGCRHVSRAPVCANSSGTPSGLRGSRSRSRVVMPSLVGECLAIMSRRSLALQQHTVECACARLRVAAGRRTDEDDEDDENKEDEIMEE